MVMESIETGKSLRSKARIALIREKVALSKLEHLKYRYDAIFEELAATKKELLRKEETLRDLLEKEA